MIDSGRELIGLCREGEGSLIGPNVYRDSFGVYPWSETNAGWAK
jgi:hypothetical protein